MELVDAGALPLVLLTGAQLAEEAINARAGQKVLVTGALGGVGRVAVYTAKARGATVYAGVRKSQKTQAADLGADAIVALDDDAEIAALAAALDAIADTVSGDVIKKLLGKVKTGGTVGSVLGEPEGAKEKRSEGRCHHDPQRSQAAGRCWCGQWLTASWSSPSRLRRFPFSQAAAAHKLAVKAGAGGKVLLVP